VKKSINKLNLTRETLRALESVQGGAKPTPPLQTTAGQTSCDYTLSCPELCHIDFTTA
jgi:hypothetical protein